MAEPEVVEDFFGVYLLYNINPKYKGRTYIGYTRDPNRRIMQHNRGTWAGGAHRTSNRGPWKMVMIVHGFPNNISALRFEWAWQNPTKTTRLQHLSLKRVPRKETEFRFQLRVVSEMLRVGPWCRLPLTIRWLEKDFYEEFPPEREPPSHMKICHGPVKSKNLRKSKDTHATHTECLLCSGYITSANSKLSCLNPHCDLVSHITCLAQLFLEPTEFVPIQGQCPFCSTMLKWGDLIRKMRGCGQDTLSQEDDNCSNDDDEILSQDRAFVDNNSIWLQDCDEL
ncbi:structure-specific endonuclease subunit SLX1 homolog [Leguminivora glycinivorella]|uniref:structure-specific endonuclease subunit SLX1 homolog n=1 Tax=Leguminivora glycinivorella TaxID=1035111 RepID=UPI00200DEDB4|nr:structure-specific endonuclease subunit SLX1 homolog [Leguminivora glycinivorella]